MHSDCDPRDNKKVYGVERIRLAGKSIDIDPSACTALANANTSGKGID